ncbi:uncharacterized protein FFB14_07452 [Fusarium fujikuroi]|nr:uncharacterized protein FFB14_07452 [Fusarium fujikuroi]
MLYLVTALL